MSDSSRVPFKRALVCRMMGIVSWGRYSKGRNQIPLPGKRSYLAQRMSHAKIRVRMEYEYILVTYQRKVCESQRSMD